MLLGFLMSVSSFWIAETASLRNAPGAKLKDNVTEGNGPRWLIASGAKDGFRRAMVSRGICCPVLGDLMRMACKLFPSKCQLGSTSRITLC